jgi:hypothetical protein
MHASRYRTEVFDGRRVGTAFDTFLNYLRRGRTHEDLWLAVLVRHPTATQSELEVAGAASADVIRYEKRQVGDSGYAATLEQKTRDTRPKKFGAYAGPSQLAAEQLSAYPRNKMRAYVSCSTSQQGRDNAMCRIAYSTEDA